MTCGSPYPRVAAEMLACGVRWGWQCWERAGCAPAAGRASWPICLQALATAPEQFSYLEAHFYNSTAPGFFFFKYRESVCCRTHGSFLLRVVLCRGKICRAGPLSFSSSSSTPALGLPALGSAICAAGKEPQTLGFLVASHLHHNLLQTVSSWPSIATCMQQALKPLPSLAWKQFLGLSLHSPRIFTHKSHLAAVVLITPFMGLLPPLQATVGPQQCPSSLRGPYVERTGLAPNPQASTPFPGSHFPFLQMKGFPLPPQQDNFPVMCS